jgi:sn-1 stearoyl-lipid 9-desaturase
VAMVTWGEGWHNNHHAHPTSARHGLTWYEIDLNWYAIWIMNKLGLARQIRRAKISEQQRPEDVAIPATVPAAQSDLVSA